MNWPRASAGDLRHLDQRAVEPARLDAQRVARGVHQEPVVDVRGLPWRGEPRGRVARLIEAAAATASTSATNRKEMRLGLDIAHAGVIDDVAYRILSSSRWARRW